MVSFPRLFINFLMIGLVVFALFSAVFQFQAESGNTELFVNSLAINQSFGDLNESLEDIRNNAQTQKELFEKDSNTGIGFLLFRSIISAGKVFNSMVIGIYNAIITLPAIVFRADPITIAVLTTILIFTIIAGVWFLIKGGTGR